MFKIKLTEETRFGIMLFISLLVLPLLMLLLNYLLGGDDKSGFVEKEKEKTVIVSQMKQNATPSPAPPPESVVSSVRDAIKKGNYSTAHLEIDSGAQKPGANSGLGKQLAEEAQKSRAPGVRKEAASPGVPLRYLDESTPRNRDTDAIYIYFVDITGTLWPRFCIQAAAKRPLGITGFTITADSKKIDIIAAPIKLESTGKGVSEWYDVPLDRVGYDAVQAMMKAKKATLTVIGSGGKTTRNVTENEIKGFRNILAGYTALGGNLGYLEVGKSATSTPGHKTKHPR